MKAVTVETKDVCDVKDCFRRCVGYKKTDEDRIEDYIKRELRING